MKTKDLIRKTIEELLKKMSFKEAVVEIKKQEDNPALIVSVQIDEAGQLIGQGGSNLNDFQRILRLLISKKIDEMPLFLLDINNYREKREDFLKELAKEMAGQVAKTKSPVTLQPMSSYERRIVHVELAKVSEVITESIGEREDRRLVIKPQDYGTS